MADNLLKPGTSMLGATTPDPVETARSEMPQASIPDLPTALPKSQELLDFEKSVYGEAEEFKLPTSNDMIASLEANRMNGVFAATDAFADSKQVMADFHNPELQNQFYDRYEAHGDFEELGFNPYRNNEEFYNEHGSMMGELSRSYGQAVQLSGLGFIDAASFGALSDVEIGEKYEKAMAIGSSSVGGVGGFTANLLLNSGYTVGILGELAVEEILMAGATAGLTAMGAFGGVTLPAAGATATRMATKAVSASTKIGRAWKRAGKIKKTLDSFKDASKARTFFKNSLKNTGKFLNPLENTTDFIRSASTLKRAQEMGKLNNFAKISKGVGAFYKDARTIRLAYGEGALEGGMNEIQIAKDMTKHYQDTHDGEMPDKEAAAEIRRMAKQSGETTALVNAPLIFLSDKLMFDGLVRGKFKNMKSSILRGHGGKILYSPGKGVKAAYSAVPENFFKAQHHYLSHPKHITTAFLNYTKANWTEGFQEVAQDAIGHASSQYYMDEYSNNPARGGYMQAVADGLVKQTNMQGFETFMSGFLMGGMVSPISKAIGVATGGKAAIDNMTTSGVGGWINDQTVQRAGKTKEQFEEYKAQKVKTKTERKAKLIEDVNTLNEFYAKPEKYLSEDLLNLVQQKEYQKAMASAIKNGDKKTYYDMKDTAGFKHVTTALKYDRLQNHIDLLEETKNNLTEEEIKESWGVSKEQFDTAIDTAVDRSNRIQQRWDKVQEKYPNPFDPNEVAAEDRDTEASKQKAWNASIEEVVFNQYSFDQALARQEKILNKAREVSGLKDVSITDFNTMFDLGDVTDEIDHLTIEIEGLEFEGQTLITSASQKALKYKKEKKAKLEAYSAAVEKAKTRKDETLTKEEYDELHKAYIDYSKFLAEGTKDFVNSDALDESFDYLVDHLLLQKRTKAANDAVNFLLAPENFQTAFERKADIVKLIMDNKKASIKHSLELFLTQKQSNDLLNALYDFTDADGKKHQIFFNPKELEDLMTKGIVPKAFYFAGSDNKWDEEVSMSTPLYNQIIDKIREYVDVPLVGIDAGLHVTSKAEKAQFEQANTLTREKNKEDKRTYAEIADEYGFDPQKESTTLKLIDVLKVMLKSKYLNTREKAMVRELLKVADPNETVTFTKNGKAQGKFSFTEQTVIDARFSSEDYQQGKKGNPIEHVILKEEMNRRVYESLDKDSSNYDSQFKDRMVELYNASILAYNDLTAVQKEELDSATTLGLTTDLEGFMSNAMNNEAFQKFLGTVPVTKSNAAAPSVWKQFIKNVLANVKNLLGGNVNGTVLNEMLVLMSTKIVGDFEHIAPAAEKTTTNTTDKVDNKIKINSLKTEHPKLAADLVKHFNQENERRAKNGEDLLLKGFDTMTPGAILNTDAFEKWFRDAAYKSKEDIINKYNKPKTEKHKPKTEKTVAPKILTDVMFKKLKELGWTKGEVQKMGTRVAQANIDAGLTKQQHIENAAIEKAEREKTEPTSEENARIVNEVIDQLINNATNFKELGEAEKSIFDVLLDPKYAGIKHIMDAAEIELRFEEKRLSLDNAFEYDSMVVGDTVVMRSKSGSLFSKAKVVNKTKSIVTIEYINGKMNGQKKDINKKDVKTHIKFMNEKAKTKPAAPITEKDKQIKVESLKINSEVDINAANKKSLEEQENSDIGDLEKNVEDKICG